MHEKVILAYSGGLDTSVSIKWIQERYASDVITVTLDLGQADDLAEIGERAKELGVRRHYSLDEKKEFAEEYVMRSIKANGVYEGKYPLSTALGRPLIAKKLVEIAERENATAVAHGCTGKGNDQVRIDVTVKALNPDLEIIAPVREWNMTRDQEIAYAKRKGIPIPLKKSVYSVDQNLWGRSIEGGILEDAKAEPPNDLFEWVVPPEKAPDTPAYVKIRFEKGIPTSIDDEDLSAVQLIDKLNNLAGSNGIGIIDHIEDRLIGIKSREVYECPAATVLLEAHRELEKLVMTRHQLNFKQIVDKTWSELAYTGLWVDPLREDLDAFVDSSQNSVNGFIKVKMYKGGFRVVSRSSEFSMYDINFATYSSDSKFNQQLAAGFIEFWGLQSRMARMRHRRQKVTAK